MMYEETTRSHHPSSTTRRRFFIFDCLPYSNCSVDNILGASGHKSDPVAFLFGFYKREGIMKVLLLRHGESANNALFKHIERTRPDASREELFEQWSIKRSEDPPLTTHGVEQARRAGKFYSSLFAQANVRVFSSPTLRALQTSKEFIRNINVAAPVAVLDNLYERDGIYHTRRNVRSKTKKELKRIFPELDFSSLPDGPWYTLDHKETSLEAVQRSQDIVHNWLTSPSFIRQNDHNVIVLVVHRELINLLLVAFVGGSNAYFFHDNTATSLIDIGSKDEIQFRWINRMDHIHMSESRALL